MIDFASTPNTSGAFPNVVGLNSTSPSATDGTPYLKSKIDDDWGFAQALMNHAGLTPNAVTESASASQRLDAILSITIGAGCVVAWCGSAADPTTVGRRMLPLNGQGILRASYTALDTVVYVGDGYNDTAAAFYHADDAAGTIRNTTGVYLILPDFRGYVIRGRDTAGAVDPDGFTRTMGDVQDWAIKKHTHYVWDSSVSSYGTTEDIDLDLTTPDKKFIEMHAGAMTSSDIIAQTITTASVPTANQSDDESRMINVTARWVITY